MRIWGEKIKNQKKGKIPMSRDNDQQRTFEMMAEELQAKLGREPTEEEVEDYWVSQTGEFH